MRKIKKIFKFISCLLLYLIVSVGSAYGVINISLYKAAHTNLTKTGSAENVIPEEITTIIALGSIVLDNRFPKP